MQDKVRILKALACETRIKIIEELLKNPKCAKDLSSCVGKDISTISRHLEILERAGILKIKKEGKRINVEIRNPDILKKLFEILEVMGSESV